AGFRGRALASLTLSRASRPVAGLRCVDVLLADALASADDLKGIAIDDAKADAVLRLSWRRELKRRGLTRSGRREELSDSDPAADGAGDDEPLHPTRRPAEIPGAAAMPGRLRSRPASHRLSLMAMRSRLMAPASTS